VLDLALEIDRLYHNEQIEMKLVIGVAGCQRSCSEPSTKDIGIRAHPQGYEILVGGSAGMNPQVGASIGIVATDKEVLSVISAIIVYLKRHGKKTARLGRLINKHGLEEFKDEVFKTIKLI
jgi:NAD(P)H-nitrite reductase large subunit